MLAVIDYGAGNLLSVMHALHHLGVDDIVLVQDGNQLAGADKIILPGVGAFGQGMIQLREKQIVDPLKAAIEAGVPYFGICLGMQFLFGDSDEMGTHQGLGILPGKVRRFPKDHPLKVPHMGWNRLLIQRASPLMDGIMPESYAYFVHSYYCLPDNADDVFLMADYGIQFAVGVQRDNIFGVQFHPEKSQKVGLRLLQNFIEMTV